MPELQACTTKRFTVKDCGVLKIIDLEKVDFFEVNGKSLKVSIGNNKYLIRASLKALADILPDQFIRVHARYVVNVESISSIDLTNKTLYIGKKSILFSRNHKASLLQVFSLF